MQKQQKSRQLFFGDRLGLFLILSLALFALAFFVGKSTREMKVVTASAKSQAGFRPVPEYERSARQILISISNQNYSGSLENLLAEVYEPLLESFPAYSRFKIIVTSNNLEKIQQLIARNGWTSRTEFLVVDDASASLEAWAQDFFEPATNNDGQNIFVFPGQSPEVASKIKKERANQRTSVIKKALTFEKKVESPFWFEGGNIMVAKNQSGLPLILADFETAWRHYDKKNPTEAQVRSFAGLFSRNFGGTQVAIIGNKERKNNFLHLDQSVLFLPDNVALVNKFTDLVPSSAARDHDTYARQLEALGFRVLYVGISQKDLKKSQSVLNAIPFFDQSNGKHKVIFPVYENDLADASFSDEKLSRKSLSGKALQMYDLLESLGIEPAPLLDKNLFKNKAGFHCVVNVLE